MLRDSVFIKILTIATFRRILEGIACLVSNVGTQRRAIFLIYLLDLGEYN